MAAPAVAYGAYAVYALIAAAVTASAVTAVKASTGQIENVGQGFEEWFKSYLISAGVGLAGGYAGAAMQAAGAAAEGVGAAAEGTEAAAEATQAGIEAGQAAQIGAEAPTIMDSGAEISTELPTAMEQAELLAANTGGAFDQTAFAAVPEVGLSVADTSGQTAPGFLESLKDFNVSSALYQMLGGKEDDVGLMAQTFDSTQEYAQSADQGVSRYQQGIKQQRLQQQQQRDSVARFMASQVFNPMGKQGSYLGWQQSEIDSQQQQQSFSTPDYEYKNQGGFMSSSNWLNN